MRRISTLRQWQRKSINSYRWGSRFLTLFHFFGRFTLKEKGISQIEDCDDINVNGANKFVDFAGAMRKDNLIHL